MISNSIKKEWAKAREGGFKNIIKSVKFWTIATPLLYWIVTAICMIQGAEFAIDMFGSESMETTEWLAIAGVIAVCFLLQSSLIAKMMILSGIARWLCGFMVVCISVFSITTSTWYLYSRAVVGTQEAVLNNPKIVAMQNEVGSLESQRERLGDFSTSDNFLAANRNIKELNSQIANLNDKIATESANSSNSAVAKTASNIASTVNGATGWQLSHASITLIFCLMIASFYESRVIIPLMEAEDLRNRDDNHDESVSTPLELAQRGIERGDLKNGSEAAIKKYLGVGRVKAKEIQQCLIDSGHVIVTRGNGNGRRYQTKTG